MEEVVAVEALVRLVDLTSRDVDTGGLGGVRIGDGWGGQGEAHGGREEESELHSDWRVDDRKGGVCG